MRILFICHSQAHLILASGLSKGRFRNEENHLVLFRDFNLKNDMREKLISIFDSCLFLEGTFPSSSKSGLKARIRWHREDNQQLKMFIQRPYDVVFAVCDWTPPVQYALKRCFVINRATEYIWLEDGILAYYPNIIIHKGADRYAITMLLRKFYFKYIKGIGKFYDRDFDSMGGLSVFHKAYVLYPEAVREPYRIMRELVGITNEEYYLGLMSLYDVRELNIPDNAVLLVMDKFDTYEYPEKVKEVIEVLKDRAAMQGRRVYCKLHPRENEIWDVFDGCVILDNTIGAESLYLSLLSKKEKTVIVGFKSAGLMSARKMGYRVESLFGMSGEVNNDLEAFFKKIGIIL